MIEDFKELQRINDSFKIREAQVKISDHIYEGLMNNKHTYAQASTGTGKSLAYLFAAAKTGSRTLISVGTKNLQDQIENDKDIVELLYPDVKIVVIKGKSNYACLMKMANTQIDNEEIMHSNGEIKLGHEKFAIEKTPVCLECKYKNRCIYVEKKKAVEEADIVVCNNSLTIIASLCKDLLPNFVFSNIIFDEAQQLRTALLNYSSVSITRSSILYLSDKYNLGIDKRKLIAAFSTLGTYPSLVSSKTMALMPSFKKSLPHTYVLGKKACDAQERDILRYEKYNKLISDYDPDDIDYCYEGTSSSISKMKLKMDDIFKQVKNSLGGTIVMCSATLSQISFKNLYNFTDLYNHKLTLPDVYNREIQLDCGGIEYARKLSGKDCIHQRSDKIAEIASHLATKTKKPEDGIMILFTSNRELELTVSKLDKGIKVYYKEDMENFKNDTVGGIMVGVDSLWQGVDIKGRRLQYLMIAKLPYQVPTPSFKKLELLLKKDGISAYNTLMKPDMMTRLYQGIGRLLRDSSDTGRIIVMDNRIAGIRELKSELISRG